MALHQNTCHVGTSERMSQSHKKVSAYWERECKVQFYLIKFQKKIMNTIMVFNSVQMFEPFQDQNQHSFWIISLSWFVMLVFWKHIRSIYLWPNHSGKKVRTKFRFFLKVLFIFLLCNWVFWTNIENNSAVTLHFEDLAVQTYLFLKDVCICWWKISFKKKILFMNVQFFLYKYFEDFYP